MHFKGGFASVAAQLRDIAEEHDVCGLVAGWPITLNGSEGLACARVRGFLGSLQCEGGMDYLPATLWDERYTSAGARDVLGELAKNRASSARAGAEPAKREWRRPPGKRLRRTNVGTHHCEKRVADSVAAALILGSFLAGGGGQVAADDETGQPPASNKQT